MRGMTRQRSRRQSSRRLTPRPPRRPPNTGCQQPAPAPAPETAAETPPPAPAPETAADAPAPAEPEAAPGYAAGEPPPALETPGTRPPMRLLPRDSLHRQTASSDPVSPCDSERIAWETDDAQGALPFRSGALARRCSAPARPAHMRGSRYADFPRLFRIGPECPNCCSSCFPKKSRRACRCARPRI